MLVLDHLIGKSEKNVKIVPVKVYGRVLTETTIRMLCG